MVAGLIGGIAGRVRDAVAPQPKLDPFVRPLDEAERYSLRVRAARGPAKQRLIRDRAYACSRTRAAF